MRLIRYLLGGRGAILDLASRRRLLMGFLFVLSAGVAREWDLENPFWHMLVPAAVSLGASFLLFTGVYRELGDRPPNPPFLEAYKSFLCLFWWTAPMAWLYAVPWERHFSAADAMRANLLTLCIVSAWRVALMTRVLVVLLGYRPWHAFALVMAYADVVVLVAMFFVPVPLIDFMGGIERSESEKVLQSVASTVCTLGVLTLPIWLIAAGYAWRRSRPAWQLQG
jgi:hypothetical protein